jgi:hypothetical protein
VKQVLIHKRESKRIGFEGKFPIYISWNLCKEPLKKDEKNSYENKEVTCKKCLEKIRKSHENN